MTCLASQSAAKSKERRLALKNELQDRFNLVNEEAQEVQQLHDDLASDLALLATLNAELQEQVRSTSQHAACGMAGAVTVKANDVQCLLVCQRWNTCVARYAMPLSAMTDTCRPCS